MFLKLLKAFGISLTLFRMGFFGAAKQWGGRGPFLTFVTHFIHNETCTVIPYLKEIQNIYK